MKAVVVVMGDIRQEHLLGKINTLGSALDNTILIQDRMVADHHAEIRRTPDGEFELVDLESTHGTFIGKERIDRQVLREGDEIILGVTRLVFRAASAADSTRRWAERYPCDFPVQVELESGRPVEARASVISLKGMQLEMDPPPAAESLITVTMKLPDTGEILRTRARVAQATAGRTSVGVAFLFDSEESQAALMRQLRQLILEAPRRA